MENKCSKCGKPTDGATDPPFCPDCFHADPPAAPPAQGLEPAKALADPPAPALSQAPPDPPPAAQIVLEGTVTERELALERELKNVQTRASELEDENRRLKTPPTPPRPKPRDRWTFFDDE